MEKVLRKSLICLGMLLLASFSFGQDDYLFGTVLYHNAVPMEGVTADLVDSTGTIINTTTTNSAGFYEFTNVAAGNYTIEFSTTEPAGGITLTDAYLVMLHIMNIYPFTPFQEEVADVNNSGTVDWFDYTDILIGYLNQGIPFSGGDWVFETRYVTVSGGSRDGWTTLGGSVGDVNGTFQPPKYGNCFIDENLAPVLVADMDEQVRISLEAQQALEITGMHIVFEVPQELSVVGIHSSLPGINYHLEGQTIRVTWMNDEPVAFNVQATAPVFEMNVVSNSHTLTGEEIHVPLGQESHFTGREGEMLPFISLSLPGVTFEEKADIDLHQSVYPNPFIAYTNLEYELPAAGYVKILVTTNSGQIIDFLAEGYQEAGPHKMKIDGSNWPAGIYHYAIQFSEDKEMIKTGSMIKSK